MHSIIVMEEVNKAKLNRAIWIFPHTFCEETFLNTQLEGCTVTINNHGLHSDYDNSFKYSVVVIGVHGTIVCRKYNLSLQECIRIIQNKCISYKQQINLERDLLFDTPIEA